mgnify:CR=1 FL=1
MAFSLKSVGDTTTGEVVGGELYLHLVAGKDADVMHAHLARYMTKNNVSIFQLDPKRGVRQVFYDLALHLNHIVF